MSSILLHCCCAPCAVGCVERLRGMGYDKIVLFYSNSNIAPFEEYVRRLESMRRLAKIAELPLIEDVYDHTAWQNAIAGFESEPERGARCPLCFGFSLGRAAARCAELGLGAFTTSLSVSPHKNSQTLFAAGGKFPGFTAIDFKKRDGFRRSRELARQYGFYLQTSCGCEFSRPAHSSDC